MTPREQAAALIVECQEEGIEIAADAKHVYVKPASALTAQLRKRIAALKGALMAIRTEGVRSDVESVDESTDRYLTERGWQHNAHHHWRHPKLACLYSTADAIKLERESDTPLSLDHWPASLSTRSTDTHVEEFIEHRPTTKTKE